MGRDGSGPAGGASGGRGGGAGAAKSSPRRDSSSSPLFDPLPTNEQVVLLYDFNGLQPDDVLISDPPYHLVRNASKSRLFAANGPPLEK